VPQHVHQEEPVGGAGVAGAEHRVGAGVAVDVGHAVGGVADDRHARLGRDRRGDSPRGHAEGRVLEVGADAGVGERRRAVDEVFVERLLVGVVGRQGAEPTEGEDLGEGVEAVLARRQDVAEAAGVIGAVGLGRRVRGRHDQRGDEKRRR
jgi:hypothetical protein